MHTDKKGYKAIHAVSKVSQFTLKAHSLKTTGLDKAECQPRLLPGADLTVKCQGCCCIKTVEQPREENHRRFTWQHKCMLSHLCLSIGFLAHYTTLTIHCIQASTPDLRDCKLEDFKVQRMLGTGSFGRVSLAKHTATGQVCAIKALSKQHILKNQQVVLLQAIAQFARLVASTTYPTTSLQRTQINGFTLALYRLCSSSCSSAFQECVTVQCS